MTCPKCRASRLVEIELSIDDRVVTMRSCSRCDTRWWVSGGETLPLPGVLQLAGNRR